jgi:asparagine synthase (glutamine-hydrolysing)
MMYVDIGTYLAADTLPLLDRMTMAVSLEARVPLLDHRLVEFAARLPGALRMRGGELKWLLRRALRGRVPDAILDREKQGFGPPVGSWMDGELGRGAEALLRGRNAGIRTLLREDWLLGQVGPARRSEPGYRRRLWSLLALELWWRTFVSGDGPQSGSVQEMALADAGGAACLVS